MTMVIIEIGPYVISWCNLFEDSRKGGTEVSLQALSSKMGGEEGQITFMRKAVNFQRVIIHVINVGRSHFSNERH